jgi:hypothetical protein
VEVIKIVIGLEMVEAVVVVEVAIILMMVEEEEEVAAVGAILHKNYDKTHAAVFANSFA